MMRPIDRVVRRHNVCTNHDIATRHQYDVGVAYLAEYGNVWPFD